MPLYVIISGSVLHTQVDLTHLLAMEYLGGFSSEFNFTSPPTTSQRSFSVMVYGDMGVTNSADNLKQVIGHKDDVDFSA